MLWKTGRPSCLRMLGFTLVSLAMLASITTAQASFSARMLRVVGIYASRAHDSTVYCLVGEGSCVFSAPDAGGADGFIAAWLASHPSATVIPISEQSVAFPLHAAVPREVYVWITDGKESLNVSLVRGGFYAARQMVDMVERDRRFREALGPVPNENRGMRTGIERQLERVSGENPPHRLVSDSDYAAKAEELLAAEKQAKQDLQGIWSQPAAHPAVSGQPAAFPARELYTVGIRGHRQDEREVYCLLGGSAWVLCLSPLAGPPAVEQHALICRWLADHPRATAIPISTGGWKVDTAGPPAHVTYIWIEDSADSLNLHLIRQGLYPAETLKELQWDKEVETDSVVNDAPRRLVSDPEYAARMQRAVAAEADAKRRGRGIWSPAGMKYRTPPTDEYMLSEYRHHRQWFQRIQALVASDARLADMVRNPAALREALDAGVPERSVREYVSLLERLHANETGSPSPSGGIGRICLITADIVYGLLLSGGGTTKGYVFSPADPTPIVADLDGPSQGESMIKYRAVADGWYLFELNY